MDTLTGAAEGEAGLRGTKRRVQLVLRTSWLATCFFPAGVTDLQRQPRGADSNVQMLFPLDSPLVVRDETRSDRVVKPGQMIWLAEWMRYSIVCPRPSNAAAASIPSGAIDEYGDPSAFGVVENSALLEPVRSFLLSLTRGEREMTALSEYFTEKLVAEMAASLILESRGVRASARPDNSLVDQAMTHISAHRSDLELSPASVAQALNVSLRQLQRAFSATGTSPGQEIRRQRAELAVSMLTDHSFRVLSVGQIATHAGFSSTAELRRALARFHDCTPRQLRGSAGTDAG